MTRTNRWLLRLLIAGIPLLPVAAGVVYLQVDDRTRDAYAVWWVADMVIVHMEQNDGAWPRGWDDLRAPCELCVERARARPWAFESLRQRVSVDFDAEVEELKRQSKPLRVIWLRDGTETHWADHDPNGMVRDHLRGMRAARPVVGGLGGE